MLISALKVSDTIRFKYRASRIHLPHSTSLPCCLLLCSPTGRQKPSNCACWPVGQWDKSQHLGSCFCYSPDSDSEVNTDCSSFQNSVGACGKRDQSNFQPLQDSPVLGGSQREKRSGVILHTLKVSPVIVHNDTHCDVNSNLEPEPNLSHPITSVT